MNIHTASLIRSSAYIDGQWLAASDAAAPSMSVIRPMARS
jgi:hypothetical protein